MRTLVTIAGTTISLETEFQLSGSEQFTPFVSQSREDFTVKLQETDNLQTDFEKMLFQDLNIDVVLTEDKKQYRRFYDRTKGDVCYAMSCLSSDGKSVLIQYIKDGLAHVQHIQGLFYHIGLESLLLQKDRLILHSSCVETNLGGILFSGPSGVGKSTQGDLWCQFENARLINGDRPIVGKSCESWLAYGSPYAGSSKCYVNASVPIRTIVLLEKSDSCEIYRIKPAEAFRRVLEQVTANHWDPLCMEHVCELVSELVLEVPVYGLKCTPDVSAIDCLKRALTEECDLDAKQ